MLLMPRIKSLKCMNGWSGMTGIAHQTEPVNYFVCSINNIFFPSVFVGGKEHAR